MGKQAIVVYKSSTGFTKKYAQIIADKINCATVDYRLAEAGRLAEYQFVIFGSRAFAGGIDGYKKIRELHEKHKIKRLVLFVTGATPDTEKEQIEQFWKQNLTDKELRDIPHFYMPGGLCYEKMTLVDRWMMKGAAAMLKRKMDKTDADIAFEQAITRSYDISSETYAVPLLDYVKGELQKQQGK